MTPFIKKLVAVPVALSMVVLAMHLVAMNFCHLRTSLHQHGMTLWLYLVTSALAVLAVLLPTMIFNCRVRLGRGELTPSAARRWLVAMIVTCPFGAGVYYLRVVAGSLCFAKTQRREIDCGE